MLGNIPSKPYPNQLITPVGASMISICMLTKNSERFLASTLKTLVDFPEVIVFDTGSTDKTLEIAREFPNVCLFQGPFEGFGPLRNRIAKEASHDWILALDSDELLSEELRKELLRFEGNPNCVYEINFHNYYRGKWIKGCGWHPEYHIRLYHRKKTKFSDLQVHEGVLSEGLQVIRLRNPIHHTPYLSTSDFLMKMQHYSDLFAKEYQNKRSSSFTKALLHKWAAFFKSYFLKKGFLMGQEGFIISLYNANTAFYKYLKLSEYNNQKK